VRRVVNQCRIRTIQPPGTTQINNSRTGQPEKEDGPVSTKVALVIVDTSDMHRESGSDEQSANSKADVVVQAFAPSKISADLIASASLGSLPHRSGFQACKTDSHRRRGKEARPESAMVASLFL
jgi:hypothetical protein